MSDKSENVPAVTTGATEQDEQGALCVADEPALTVLGGAFARDGECIGILITVRQGEGGPAVLHRLCLDDLSSPARLAKRLTSVGWPIAPGAARRQALLERLHDESKCAQWEVFIREGWYWAGVGSERKPIVVRGDRIFGAVPERSFVMLDRPSDVRTQGSPATAGLALTTVLTGNPYAMVFVSLALSPIVSTAFDLPIARLLLVGGNASEAFTLSELAISLSRDPRLVDPVPAGTAALRQWLAGHNDMLTVIHGHRTVSEAYLDELEELAREGVFGAGLVAIQGIQPGNAVQGRAQLTLARREAVLPRIDVGTEHGLIHALGDAADLVEFVGMVANFIEKNYGTTHERFEQKILKKYDYVLGKIPGMRAECDAAIGRGLMSGLDPVARQVLAMFTTVAITGTLAVKAGLFDIPADDIVKACRALFRRWHEGWLARDAEPAELAVRMIKTLIRDNPKTAFVPLARWTNDDGNLLGYSHDSTVHGRMALIEPDAFSRLICKSMSVPMVIGALSAAGMLITTAGSTKLQVRMPRVAGAPTHDERRQFYAIKWSSLED